MLLVPTAQASLSDNPCTPLMVVTALFPGFGRGIVLHIRFGDDSFATEVRDDCFDGSVAVGDVVFVGYVSTVFCCNRSSDERVNNEKNPFDGTRGTPSGEACSIDSVVRIWSG